MLSILHSLKLFLMSATTKKVFKTSHSTRSAHVEMQNWTAKKKCLFIFKITERICDFAVVTGNLACCEHYFIRFNILSNGILVQCSVHYVRCTTTYVHTRNNIEWMETCYSIADWSASRIIKLTKNNDRTIAAHYVNVKKKISTSKKKCNRKNEIPQTLFILSCLFLSLVSFYSLFSLCGAKVNAVDKPLAQYINIMK